MADDAELAFLKSQEEYDPSAAWPAAEAQAPADDDDEYDPDATFSPGAPSQSDHSQSASESAANTPSQEVGNEVEDGLKPQPVAASAETSAAPTPAKQPRTMGGFVVESEDEEEEPVEAPNTAGPSGAAETPQRSITNTPNNTLPTPDVQLPSAQDQGAPSVFSASVAVNEPAPSVASVPLNGTTPVPDATKPGAPDSLIIESARQSAAPITPAPTSASLPKPRLPQDRVGILEDRVAEDPRGDIEAWLSLIEEHRRRHKHDDARAVFERFLKVFPTAVSYSTRDQSDGADLCRASNGSSTSTSRRSSMSYRGLSICSAGLFH
jgi:cleavage stimulation factor subunit 3